jgi:hypothetical protein
VKDLDIAESHDLLTRVVEELFAKRHSPVPGALVKAQIITEAAKLGVAFDERRLGYRNFQDFVSRCSEVAHQGRPGSDMLLAPKAAEELLSAYTRPLPKLRRDFWRAFIEFSVPQTVRLYDPQEDKVVYENLPTLRKGIPIDPIPRQTQIEWRRAFADDQSEETRGLLLEPLSSSGNYVFNEFARRLRENPALMKAWNRYLQKKITDHVMAWAQENNVPEDRWSGGMLRSHDGSTKSASPENAHPVGQRSELYNFFDNLPLEDLLQLRVPLEWVLKVTRDEK